MGHSAHVSKSGKARGPIFELDPLLGFVGHMRTTAAAISRPTTSVDSPSALFRRHDRT
jgi:hypothetical protein